MPATQSTSNPYSSVTVTQTTLTNCIAAAFAAITATNTNITLYQNSSNAGINYLVYACTNPIGSGTYNTVYLAITVASAGSVTLYSYETWNTSTFTGTNGVNSVATSSALSSWGNLAYYTYTDNASYGLVLITNVAQTVYIIMGYCATVANNAFQSENTMPSTVGISSNNLTAPQILPTTRTSTSSIGNAIFTPSFGTQGTNSYANSPVINYPIGLNGLGALSNDLGLTTYAFNLKDTVTIGSQIWTKVSFSGTNLGLFVRTT